MTEPIYDPEEKNNPENLPAKQEKPHIPIKNGQLVPQDAAGLFYLAAMMSKTSMVPDQYRGDPHSTFVAIQLGMEVGLRPMAALQNIAVIKGKPTIYADGITGLLHGSGKCEYINEWFEADGNKVDPSDLDQDPGQWPSNLKAVSEIKRQGSAQQLYRGTFSVADARRMGTWNSKDVWKKFPARMLMWRARTYAARDGFSDVLKGLGVFEEVIDYDADLEQQNGHYGVPEEVVKPVEGQVVDAEMPEEKKELSLFDKMCLARNIDPKVALEYCQHIHDVTGAPILTITCKAIENPDGFTEKFRKWNDPTDDGDPMGIDEPDESPFQDPPAPVIDEDGFSADTPPEKKAEVQARTADSKDPVSEDIPPETGDKVDVPSAEDVVGGEDAKHPGTAKEPVDPPTPSKKSTIKKWLGLRGEDFKNYVEANPQDFEGISSAEYKRAVDKWTQIVKPRFQVNWPIGSTEKQPEIEFPKQTMVQHLAEMKKDYPDEVKKSLEKHRFANGGLTEDAAKIVVQDVIDILGGKQIK
jgi:hypothetical protein